MPFEWTINVYRGCSSCLFVLCSSGDTPILMANGRTKPLADVRVGDTIYGTVRDGPYRRYVATNVVDHWSTVKPAYRVTLEDGTELVTSGDHRFLSDRGWKHVTGSEHGRNRRPHLTVNNKLMGTGRFAAPPDDGPDYRRGYLCGMIRGDGHVGSYAVPTARPDARGRSTSSAWPSSTSRRFAEPATYLAGLEVPTDEFVFQEAVGERRAACNAIRTSHACRRGLRSRASSPGRDAPSTNGARGSLPASSTPKGSHSRGILRICNTDPAIVDQITSCLRRFGFPFAIESQADESTPSACSTCGCSAAFESTCASSTPLTPRSRGSGSSTAWRSRATRRSGSSPSNRWASTSPCTTSPPGPATSSPTASIQHNCFARPSHTYLNFDAGRDFERKIVVKVNAPEVLRRELRQARAGPGRMWRWGPTPTRISGARGGTG